MFAKTGAKQEKKVTLVSSKNEKRVALMMRAGDTVRVWQKIKEKGKTRLQVFEGLVLARKHGNTPGGTFTVRRTASGVGVEKTFPIHSPMIDTIEVVKRTKVRRAKLFYIREKVAKEIRRTMRGAVAMGLTSAEGAVVDPASPETSGAKEVETVS